MKTTRIGQEAAETTSPLETVKMSIDASAVDHLMSNLTNLYSDPVMAILREYSSNAVDSHVRAKNSAPILITTPDRNSDYKLIVQDFGVGMSKDEIANVYSRYGLSTKGASNDEIGGFGLGCKSALAIADRFDIVSVKDGVKTTAYIQKNIKGVGVVHFVSEDATNESNGVTVSIPMGYSNSNRFNKSEMVRFFLGMPSGSVKLNGEVLPTMFDSEWQLLEMGGVELGAYYTPKVEYGTVASSFNPLSVSVGGVIYKIENLYSSNSVLSQFVNEARYYKIVMSLPIGSVDLTPSRESIMLTQRTNDTITATIGDLRQALISIVQQKIDAADSLKASVIVHKSETELGYWNHSFTYRGNAVESTVSVNKMLHIYRSETEKRKASYATTQDRIDLYEGFGIPTRYRSTSALFVKGTKADEAALQKDAYYYDVAKGGNGRVSMYIYSDSDLVDNYVLSEMVKDSTLTTSEISSVAEKFRSDSRKASIAASKAAKENGTVKVKFASLPVWNVGEADSSPMVKAMSMEDVFTKPAAYIHASLSISKLRGVFPTIGWQYDNGGVKLYDNNSGTVSVLNEALAGYNVIFLTSQRSLSKFLESYPDVKDAGVIVNEYISNFISSKHDEIVANVLLGANQYGKYTSSSTAALHNIAIGLKQFDEIKNIENEEVREIFNSVLSVKTTAEKINPRVFNNWITVPESIVEEANVIRDKHDKVIKSLVLSTEGRVSHAEYAEHLVKYINVIHAK
jgi:anti-sigma regulatory factor (Ser/Thr protein kinase)